MTKKGGGEIDVTGNKRTEQVMERDASRYHGDKGEIIRGNHEEKSQREKIERKIERKRKRKSKKRKKRK